MCCCDKPTVNGELGYKWQPTDSPSVRRPYPPELDERDVLLYDEPGRCGGIDSHCHHFRVTQNSEAVYLMVQHGGGRERYRFGWTNTALLPALAVLDSNQRYWLLCSAYHAIAEAIRIARDKETGKWSQAAVDKRIKVRRGKYRVTVDIEPKIITKETQHGEDGKL